MLPDDEAPERTERVPLSLPCFCTPNTAWLEQTEWWSGSAFINTPSGCGSNCPASLRMWSFRFACFIEIVLNFTFWVLSFAVFLWKCWTLLLMSSPERLQSRDRSAPLFRWWSLRIPLDASCVTAAFHSCWDHADDSPSPVWVWGIVWLTVSQWFCPHLGRSACTWQIPMQQRWKGTPLPISRPFPFCSFLSGSLSGRWSHVGLAELQCRCPQVSETAGLGLGSPPCPTTGKPPLGSKWG